MIYVTGDTHGETGRFTYLDSNIEKTLTQTDKLIICGDFGYVWSGSDEEEKFLDYMAKKPYQILFIDGNHENFSLLNGSYPVQQYCGGNVHIIRKGENNQPKIIHLMRGQIFEIENKKIFTMGGAYSIDKHLRIPQISWWKEELPTDNEMKEAISNLNLHGNKIDYIFTHTAPIDTTKIMGYDQNEEYPLNNFLEWIRESTTYTHWWFGHFHMDKRNICKEQTAIWLDVRETETNNIVE
ncbi:MAG: metallophosphoesterase [Clostridia bacterium]